MVDEDGQLRIEADPAAIQTTVDTLPAAVDRAPVNATNIVDSAGNVLRAEKEGATGRALGDTDGIADDFATQLAAGDGTFALSVTETPFETTNLFRRAEINLSTQRAYLFENDKVVQSWAVSTGLPGTPTPTGNFKVFAHTSMQDMGCYEGAPYCTEDVPWITWFAPNIGFHGTYWHNNFGNRMSHGCVNLPIDLAKYVYDWSPSASRSPSTTDPVRVPSTASETRNDTPPRRPLSQGVAVALRSRARAWRRADSEKGRMPQHPPLPSSQRRASTISLSVVDGRMTAATSFSSGR